MKFNPTAKPRIIRLLLPLCLHHLPLKAPEGLPPKGFTRTSQTTCISQCGTRRPLPSAPGMPTQSLPTTFRAQFKCHLLWEACQDAPLKFRTNSLHPVDTRIAALFGPTTELLISCFRGSVGSALRASASKKAREGAPVVVQRVKNLTCP